MTAPMSACFKLAAAVWRIKSPCFFRVLLSCLIRSSKEQAEDALLLYRQMQEEGVSISSRTFVSVLQACSSLAAQEDGLTTSDQPYRLTSMHKGRVLHAQARRVGHETDPFVGTALIGMYVKCGSMADAQQAFEMMPYKDVVAWTALLTAYASEGQGDMVLQLFRHMQDQGINPDDATLVCILQICGSTGNLHLCTQIHHRLLSSENALNLQVASALIHAYGTCSRMKNAQDVFDALPQPDLVCWNALIAGYVRQGNCAASSQCYDEMQLAGTKPDRVTFLLLIAACSHAGEVDKGVKCFQSMTRDHGIAPAFEHYVTMVDLLGRSGHFTMVQELLSTMPMRAGLPLWLCLLGSCQKHGNVVLGEQVFNFAVRLQPANPAAYVLASNMYAHAGMWEKARVVELQRLEAGAWKKPGICWIEHEKEVHKFLPGEWHDQKYAELYELLAKLSPDSEREGRKIWNVTSL